MEKIKLINNNKNDNNYILPYFCPQCASGFTFDLCVSILFESLRFYIIRAPFVGDFITMASIDKCDVVKLIGSKRKHVSFSTNKRQSKVCPNFVLINVNADHALSVGGVCFLRKARGLGYHFILETERRNERVEGAH